MGKLERFVSHFTNRLDAKGRVSIPAPFRAVLARDGMEGLYLYQSLHVPALDCGGHGLMGEIEDLLNMLPPYSEEWDVFATALYGPSEILKVDGEGRIVLSETCRAYAGIGSEVVFVGLGRKFQIWEPGRFQAYLGEARSRVSDLRKESSLKSAQASSRAQGARE